MTHLDEILADAHAVKASPLTSEQEHLEEVLVTQKTILDRFAQHHTAIQIAMAEDADAPGLKGQPEEYLNALRQLEEKSQEKLKGVEATEAELKDLDRELTTLAAQYGVSPTGEWLN